MIVINDINKKGIIDYNDILSKSSLCVFLSPIAIDIIKEILTDKANPIIVKNKKWKKSSKLNGFCQGFKLETKYDS